MPRPRKDQEGPSATERMENAFWEALEEKPYNQITVGEIAARAHVNKNAFYYHYNGLFDLAENAIKNTIPAELPRMLLLANEISEEESNNLIESLPENVNNIEQRANRVLLLVGKNGSQELVNVLKDLIMYNWLETFDLDEEHLDQETRAIMKFALGGILEVVSDETIIAYFGGPIQSALRGGPVRSAINNVLTAFHAAQNTILASREANQQTSSPLVDDQEK